MPEQKESFGTLWSRLGIPASVLARYSGHNERTLRRKLAGNVGGYHITPEDFTNLHAGVLALMNDLAFSINQCAESAAGTHETSNFL